MPVSILIKGGSDNVEITDKMKQYCNNAHIKYTNSK